VIAVAAAMTVADARRAVAADFRAAGLETPELDARILLGHALRLDHGALVRESTRPLAAGESAQVAALAARRLAGEPVARIVGRREFWGLPFTVTPAVLVPRPETETIVELALSLIGDRARRLRVADLGTGSGAILLALLSELPQACGIGTDLSSDALTVARANARSLCLEDRATFVASDYGRALAGPFDLVVSNPPYVARHDIATLGIEVRAHDPALALDGGADGLNAYRQIAADAARLIGAGHLAVEIGAGQEHEVEAEFVAKGLAVTGFRHDLTGRIRAVVARQKTQGL
jgi:release factor glutamine methyltransferase